MTFKEMYRQYRISFLAMAVLLLLVGVGIVPTLTGMAMTRNRIVVLESKLAYQKAFLPQYAMLTAEVKKLKDAQADWEKSILPAPASMNQALELMQRLAVEAQLQAPRFTPVPDSVLGRKDQLKIEAQVSAQTDMLRKFLYLITVQPWVISIESQVTQASASGAHNTTLGLWVQLDVNAKESKQ